MALPAAAWGQEGPRFCPTRPSLEGSACTTEPGRVHVEFSVADWELDNQPDSRTDTWLGSDFVARLGVGKSTEVQLGWSPIGYVRERDKGDNSVSRQLRSGDIRLAVRQNLRNPDGKGLSFGLEPFVTLPVGRAPIGAGTWGAGLVLPVTYDLTDTLNIGATGEADAQPDEDGAGRHFRYSGVVAASIALADRLNATIEAEWLHDHDPADPTTQALAGLGLQYELTPTRALYGEAVAGLNQESPDLHLYMGMAALF